MRTSITGMTPRRMEDRMTRRKLAALFGVPLIAGLMAAMPMTALAQAPASEAPATEAENAAAAEPAAEDAAADEGPSYPEELANPGIPLEALQLLVIPLTVDELTGLADAWLANVKRQTGAVVDRQVDILEATEAEQEDAAQSARERMTELMQQRNEAFQRYSTVVNMLERKGGDEAAVAQYRAYRNAIIVEEKQQADWRTLVDQAVAWAVNPEGGIQLAIRIGIMVAAFLGLLIVAKVVRRIARGWFSGIPNLSKLLQAFLAMLVYWLVLAVGLMVVLSALGVDITPLFALVGGASFIAAFALQDTLGNLASGLMIMINHPFDEGDYVTAAGVGGTVKSVSIVSTTVVTPDNQVIVIPNSKVWGDIITNVTASDTRRVDLTFGISYDDDIETAQKVLEDLVAAHPLVLSDPAPTIQVHELADSAVNFIVRPWTRTDDYWTVYWDLMRQVKAAFDAAGLTIPFPQTEMHIRTASGPASALGPGAAVAAAPQAGAHEPADRTYARNDEGFDEAEAGDGGERGTA